MYFLGLYFTITGTLLLWLLFIPQMKLITPTGLIERMKISGSLARAALKQMEADGHITLVQGHQKQMIYTRNTGGE
jgi:small subunit ribosomal protein S25e